MRWAAVCQQLGKWHDNLEKAKPGLAARAVNQTHVAPTANATPSLVYPHEPLLQLWLAQPPLVMEGRK